MNFAEAAKEEAKWTRTENGAVALNTTGDACLDLFGTIGSLRGADKYRTESLFDEAYREDPMHGISGKGLEREKSSAISFVTCPCTTQKPYVRTLI